MKQHAAKRSIGRPSGRGTLAVHASRFDASKIIHRSFSYDARLRRVKRFVDGHYADRLSLARVAGVAGLERSYFSRYFHRKAGVCYHDWLHWVRIGRAMECMRRGNARITDIAFSVGYRDLRTFERAFEKCTGECPRALKKQIESKVLDQRRGG